MSVEHVTAFLAQNGLNSFNTSKPIVVGGNKICPTRKRGVNLRAYRTADKSIALSPIIDLFNLPTFAADRYREVASVTIRHEQHEQLIIAGQTELKDTPYHNLDFSLVAKTKDNTPTGVWIKMINSSRIVLDTDYTFEEEETLLPVPTWSVSTAPRRSSKLPLGGKVYQYDDDLSGYFPTIRCHMCGSRDISWEISSEVNGKKIGLPLQGPLSWEYSSGKRKSFQTTEKLLIELINSPSVMGAYRMEADTGLLPEMMELRMYALAALLADLAEQRSEEFNESAAIEEAIEKLYPTKKTLVVLHPKEAVHKALEDYYADGI